MDISTIKVVERTIDIVNPGTKEPLGVTVTIMSPKDERLNKLRDSIAQKQLQLQAKGKVQKVDDLHADRRKIIFAAIVRWDWGTNNWEGEKPELTPAVFRDIDEKASWFVEQINEAFGELESFFTAAETN
jgi:hypothetical protein